MKIIEGNELEFEAEGKAIAAAFAKIVTVTTYVKADDTKFVIAAVSKTDDKKGHGLYLIGTSTDALACIRLPAEVKASGAIRLDAMTLSGLLKGRGVAQFKSGQGNLIFREKKGSFKAQIAVMDFDSEDIRMLSMQLGDYNTSALSSDVMEKLMSAARKVVLNNFYGDAVLPIVFDISEKWMKVLCFDDFHSAGYKTKVKNKTPMRMALPVKVFSMLEKFIDGEDTSFSIGGGRFRASNKDFLVSIPETQLNLARYEMMNNFVKAMSEMKPRLVIDFDTKATGTVSNMAVLTDQDTKMAIDVSDQKVTLSVRGKGGMVSDSFKAGTNGKPLDMRVDPRIFMDLFNKVKSSNVVLNVYKVPAAMSTFMLVHKDDSGSLTLIGTYDEAK